MADYKKILVAVDFSDVSVGALKAARELAQKLGATLRVVHAVPVQPGNVPLEGGAVFAEDLHESHLKDAKERLAKFLQEHGEKAGLESAVVSGEPAAQINSAAEESGADMIVMGTHGRTGLSHLLMGSVAESVLREARVPVLCVRG